MANGTNLTVVSIHRDCYRYPRLTIRVEAAVDSLQEGQEFITQKVMQAYGKKFGKRFRYIRVTEMRVVDELGLKRLRAAAKASVTIRRKRAAQKAAKTRARNRQANISNRLAAYDAISRGS